MFNPYMTERVRALGYDADVESVGTTARVTLAGRSNNRRSAEAVAALLKTMTGGRASIWETRGEFIVNVRAAGAAAAS